MSSDIDGLSGRQRDALRRLVVDGVLTAGQEEAVRAALAGAAARREGPPRWLAEISAYVGGGLMIVGVTLFLAASWHDLTRPARSASLAGFAVAFALAGVLVSGGRVLRSVTGGRAPRSLTGGRRRVVGVLFGLASVPAALAVAVSVDRYPGSVGSLVGLVVAAAGLLLLPTVPGLVATAGMSIAAVEFAAGEVLHATPLYTGLFTLALGLAWTALSVRPLLPSQPLGLAVGTGVALLGTQLPIGAAAPWAYGLTFALAVGCFVGYRWLRSVVLLAAGVLGMTLAVPEAVYDWTNGALGGSVVLLVAGAVLVGASALGLRLRRITPTPRT